MKRYSFADTIMIVNGIEIVGWDEGDDVIDIERANDSASHKMGAGGEMMVSISADRSGSFKFKLLQTSGSNAYLNAQCNLQQASGSLFVPCVCLFKDTYRNDLASGGAGYIVKPTGMKRGAKAGSQEWQINVERLDLMFGIV